MVKDGRYKYTSQTKILNGSYFIHTGFKNIKGVILTVTSFTVGLIDVSFAEIHQHELSISNKSNREIVSCNIVTLNKV